ncbi:hypothetical protein K435DRAFT_806479 [Dendrothele bispora CBS 962.96]|uniref:Uncharacterized protein n=1 Tax=Dendrothele bispora (strain CBS 962.96) TaxID=1314807 RepID=A0A4V4HCW2_DENBC|nr:hypothetical protein K435DRAFT_806479 [Dendrothele bispora CBS 962.96]
MIKSRVEPYLSSLKTGSWSRLLRQTWQRNPLPLLPSPSTTPLQNTLPLASAPQTSTPNQHQRSLLASLKADLLAFLHPKPGLKWLFRLSVPERPSFAERRHKRNDDISTSSFNSTAISIQHHPTKTPSLTSLRPKETPEVAHPFNAPTTTHHTQTTDNAPDKMPSQNVRPENRKTDEQRWRELMDFMESLWKLWVAAVECRLRFMGFFGSSCPGSSGNNTLRNEQGIPDAADLERLLGLAANKLDEANVPRREIGVVFENLLVQGLGDILNGLEGVVKPGEMLHEFLFFLLPFVLGRPGSGCSSFLKTLANQTAEYHSVTGDASYGPFTPKCFLEEKRSEFRFVRRWLREPGLLTYTNLPLAFLLHPRSRCINSSRAREVVRRRLFKGDVSNVFSYVFQAIITSTIYLKSSGLTFDMGTVPFIDQAALFLVDLPTSFLVINTFGVIIYKSVQLQQTVGQV